MHTFKQTDQSCHMKLKHATGVMTVNFYICRERAIINKTSTETVSKEMVVNL